MNLISQLKQNNSLEDRKLDHIELALKSQIDKSQIDQRFHYEPLLSSHKNTLPEFHFLGKKLTLPIWVSSMTGGTEQALKINQNLAKACAEFGMGMGLGSCRPLLDSLDRFNDFNLRPIIGNDLPFYANLGIAQIEHLLTYNQQQKIVDLVNRLQADGLIIHVNPMQEWFQPEGDRYLQPPIDTIERLLNITSLQLIVKEVGQGFGPQSIKRLLALPLAAIDFGAHGGTNFSLIEMQRGNVKTSAAHAGLALVGHDADEMTNWVNDLVNAKQEINCNDIIISGGIKNFLDGYYLIEKCQLNAVYGQASVLLNYARQNYETLAEYITSQVEGLKLSYSYLRIKE